MLREIRDRQASTEDKLPADLHPVLRRIYLNRGIGEASGLDLGLNRLLGYKSLKGIEAAVDLLSTTIDQDQQILVIGDFDADGATSTALAMIALTKLGARRVDYLVPDRFRFGYGLTPEIVSVALERSPDLIITVDNGISSIAGVAAAQTAGIKVLITDHHLPGRELPSADAMVNPNQPGCAFPSKKLAGVGVIFYVMAALRAQLRDMGQLPDPDWSMTELLDLVALGTVADVVPLDQNNRILVDQGLQRIRAGYGRCGINALAEVAQRNTQRLTASDMGFAVGPRLNAAGRLQDMSLGIECLLATDPDKARTLATELNSINMERRNIQEQMQEEAIGKIEAELALQSDLPLGLCVFQSDWHEGVVGLVASKLKERHHRPCIAFAPSGASVNLKGSARSIPGVHIRDVLDLVASRNPGLIDKFGGHAMAAGLALPQENYADFQRAFQAVLNEWVDPASLSPVIESEGELNAEHLLLETAVLIERAGPWGQGFPEPIFHGEFEVLEQRILKEKHWKLRLRALNLAQPIDAIAFNAVSADKKQLPSRVRLAYRLNINDYMGKRRLQLMVDQVEAID